MNRLLLLRHAKSSWDTPDLADHDRPLAPRGNRAVADLRRHIAATGLSPDLVLCSTARRTVETWKGIAPAFPSTTSVEYDQELYGASAGELLQRLHRVPVDTGCVLVIGHNPGMGELALRLGGSGDTRLRRNLEMKFPTGALATLTVPGPWARLRWDTGELTDFVVPRDLSLTDSN